MIKDLNESQASHNLIAEINDGFPHFWIFIIPLDLSCYKKIPGFSEDETNLNEVNLDLSVNISLNYLADDFVGIIDKKSIIPSYENSLSNVKMNKNDALKDGILINKKSNFNNSLKSFNQKNAENNSFTGILGDKSNNDNNYLNVKEEKGKKKEENIKATNYLNNNCENKSLKDSEFSLSQIQNYNINIYNPHINCVNICYPPSSLGPFPSVPKIDNNKQILNNDNIVFNEKEILKGKFPLNLFKDNNQNINNPVSNYSFNNSNNNINMIMNNSFNNLGDNFPVIYKQKEIDKYLFFNNGSNNIKQILNIIEKVNKKDKNSQSSNINGNQKLKKNKKKKKKKIDDEYTIEMFGRRGWICEGCNNFNYESRKNCNRCKIPKKPLKKSIIMDNNGNKIMDNLSNANHKDDWNCYNCGNINYAFRLNCNRCQMKKENSIQACNEHKKLE
jgi:hypothetical protein